MHDFSVKSRASRLSYKILTELLRHKLKFNWVIATDDLPMKVITDHYGLKQELTLALNAGADLLIIGNQISPKPVSAEHVINLIMDQIEAGKIKQQRIDEAYMRVKWLKSLGIPYKTLMNVIKMRWPCAPW